ncbi:MAG: magnesium transporter, partial [Leptolyngbyaceae bacterium]|nr:magnesium transporter [Leptolyngbyaceae bacterium]
MLTQENLTLLLENAELNQLKSELNRSPAVDVGDYIAELSPDHRAIAFRLLNKNQATDVFEYLPQEVQEELIGSLHDTHVCHI